MKRGALKKTRLNKQNRRRSGLCYKKRAQTRENKGSPRNERESIRQSGNWEKGSPKTEKGKGKKMWGRGRKNDKDKESKEKLGDGGESGNSQKNNHIENRNKLKGG